MLTENEREIICLLAMFKPMTRTEIIKRSVITDKVGTYSRIKISKVAWKIYEDESQSQQRLTYEIYTALDELKHKGVLVRTEKLWWFKNHNRK